MCRYNHLVNDIASLTFHLSKHNFSFETMSYVAVDPHIDHEIDTVHKVDNKSLVMPTLDSAEPNIHSMSNSNTRSRWTIGWKTPTTIVVLYLLGTRSMVFPQYSPPITESWSSCAHRCLSLDLLPLSRPQTRRASYRSVIRFSHLNCIYYSFWSSSRCFP